MKCISITYFNYYAIHTTLDYQ